jgi:hypothetical protein
MEGAIVSKIAHLLSVFSNDVDVSDLYNEFMQWSGNKLRDVTVWTFDMECQGKHRIDTGESIAHSGRPHTLYTFD